MVELERRMVVVVVVVMAVAEESLGWWSLLHHPHHHHHLGHPSSFLLQQVYQWVEGAVGLHPELPPPPHHCHC
jgi:hypothetical protein